MALFRRPARLPAEIAARIPGATPIAVAEVVGGGWLVLTAREWIDVPAGADAAVARHGWHEVDNAQWLTDTNALQVRWIDGVSREVRLVGEDPRVPQVVRERVEASIVHVVSGDLPGGVQVRAVVRRDGDGALSSQVSVVGTAATSPAMARLATELEARARADVGLPE
ncbi:hypothetical protein C8046_01055 [Serinibacter arcticus]|uniref:Uncharacterized protein n=1 Tax=Serinibacter arcticus TaxID=1655435 RepID=A0A2U1ZRB5_9MICO|nr:hypothetical protein [Serinibacter arcticus]PWD49516.1 hypothetical protein C8046_01055 [Serinibacter arcticus]